MLQTLIKLRILLTQELRSVGEVYMAHRSQIVTFSL